MNTLSLSMSDASVPGVRRWAIVLQRGEILRLDRARGATVRNAAGFVWITEEGRALDVVLATGDAHTLRGNGRAIVAADRASCVAVEWPSGQQAPRAEAAPAEGAPGRQVLPHPAGLAAIAATARAWWRAVRESAFADAVAGAPGAAISTRFSPDDVRDRLAGHMPFLRS
jgi:hypothetical protein